MDWIRQTADVLYPIGVIIGFFVTLFGLPVAIVKVRSLSKAVFTVGQTSDAARVQATHAATSSATTQQELLKTQARLESTEEALIDVTDALNVSNRANDVIRKKYDDLWAEFLQTKTVEARLRLIERWAEEQETTVHQLTRAMSTTGAPHAHQ